MPLPWASIVNEGGDLPQDEQKRLRAYLDLLGDQTAEGLESNGLSRFTSPLFRPFNIAVGYNPDGSYVFAFGALSGGIAMHRWLTISGGPLTVDEFVGAVRAQLGWEVTMAFGVPNLDKRRLRSIARQQVGELESRVRLAALGDLESVIHLRPHLEAFVKDHPDPSATAFVIMPFEGSEYLEQALEGIRLASERFGIDVLRADDKAYSDQLWLNVETYMVACRFGIAVFEDIDERAFNPNVSLELGYMLGLRKRCLLLKEKRLPKLPSDVVGHLYRSWDAFDATETVSTQVAEWFEIDVGLSPAGRG